MIDILVSTKVARFIKQNNTMTCSFCTRYIICPVCFMAAVCKITFLPQTKMKEVTWKSLAKLSNSLTVSGFVKSDHVPTSSLCIMMYHFWI